MLCCLAGRKKALRGGFCLLGFTLCALPLVAQPDFAPGQLLVRLKDSAEIRTVEELSKKHGLNVRKRFQRPLSASRRLASGTGRGSLILYESSAPIPAAVREAIANDPSVAYAEPNYTRQYYRLPNDPDFGLLWGLQNTGQILNGIPGTSGADIRYPEAWKLARNAATEVVVGVADSGVSIRHPDLLPNIWSNPGEIPDNGLDDDSNGYIDDVHGYDFGFDSPNMFDDDGHGTHVAGTIAAASDNGIGISGVYGGARLLPLKVEDSEGILFTSDIIEAFLYAVALKEGGVNLVAVNASFGGPNSTLAEFDAIADMNEAGIILCAAAGNDSADNDTTDSYPTNYDLPNIISVAASDQSHSLASFSNFGSTSVDLAAPGVNIYSTLPLTQISYSSSLTVGGIDIPATPIVYAGSTPGSGLTANVVACGLGFPSDFPASMDGQIALIQRGSLTFADKAKNALAAGAAGALIYNNVSGPPGNWTLGYESNWIPVVQLSQSDGAAIAAALPLSATLTNTADFATAYQYLNGTSMATPHVAGAVAFAALNFPDDTLSERIDRILDTVTPEPGLAGLVSTGGILNLQQLADSDSDALPDWWEGDFFGNLTKDGTADSDGDRFTDAEELLALTDPTSGNSFFALETASHDPVAGATLRFPSALGRTYAVFWSENLAEDSWEVLDDEIIGDGTVLEVPDPAATTPGVRFYRLQVTEY